MHVPAITVLMPVRDGSEYLRIALDSVLGQTFRDFELIVVDDGSIDATPEILRGYASQDTRIVVHRQDQAGVVAARNRGLAEARAPLIACLDADDIAMPERLSRQFDVMRANPRLGLLGSHAETIDEAGTVIGRRSPATSHGDLVALLKRSNPIIQSTIMFRKQIVTELGGYRKAFEGAEDYDLWLRIAEGSAIANLPAALVQYREHAMSTSLRVATRGAFSVRLAKRSAAMRSAGLPDLANELTSPPDWRRPPSGAFYARDARDFCLLEFADGEVAQSLGFDHLDLATLEGLAGRLDHSERKIAQRAILHIMQRRDRPAQLGRAKLLASFFRMHPLRATWLFITGHRTSTPHDRAAA